MLRKVSLGEIETGALQMLATLNDMLSAAPVQEMSLSESSSVARRMESAVRALRELVQCVGSIRGGE